MAKQLQLTISELCHENWEAMTPVEKGRFCDSCQKQVVDFSGMSDRQVAEFFKKPSTGSVCGRFMSDQLDRDIEIPKKRMPWVKYFFQFALPAFLLSLKTSSAKSQGQVKVTTTSKSQQNIERTIGTPSIITPDKPSVGDTVTMDEVVIRVLSKPAQPRVPYYCPETKGLLANLMNGNYSCCFIPEKPKEQVIDISKVRDMTRPSVKFDTNDLVGKVGMVSVNIDEKRNVTGFVVDEKDDPLPGVSVRIRGTRTGVAANNNGEFHIMARAGDYLVVSGVGLESKEILLDKAILDNLKISINTKGIKIKCVSITLGQVSTTRYPRKKRQAISLISSLLADTVSHTFKVFPNPVPSGSTVTIETKKATEGYYSVQLLNQSGQFAHQQQLWIEKKAKQVKIDLPVVPAGSYFLVLVNTKTGKKFTEKIIINQ